jgi:hypothetical protein
LDTAPKQEGEEFDACIKSRYDAAPDPDKHATWLQELTAKTKYYACKQIVQKTYVGRLEGIKTLAQQLTNVKQKQWDKANNRNMHLSARELSQACQRLLTELKPTTQPAEMPQLDDMFVQAIGPELRKKIIQCLPPHPATTVGEMKTYNDSTTSSSEQSKTKTNSGPSLASPREQHTKEHQHETTDQGETSITIPGPSLEQQQTTRKTKVRTKRLTLLTHCIRITRISADLSTMPQDKCKFPRPSWPSTTEMSPQPKKTLWPK